MKFNSKVLKCIIVGQLLINLPIVLICFGPPFLLLYYFDFSWAAFLLAFIVFAVCIGLAWMYWSFSITKWRVWSFQQLDMDHDFLLLKKMAIQTKLIWEDGNWFEETEIRNEEEQRKINTIQEKIDELNEIEKLKTDLDTPNAIIYPLAKRRVFIELFVISLVLSIGSIPLFTEQYILGLILLIIILLDYKRILRLYQVARYHKGLEISNRSIRLGNTTNQEIIWESMNKITVNKAKRLIEIVYLAEGQEKKQRIELWYYQIKDFDLFYSRLEVYADRFVSRWQQRSSLDN